VVLNPAIKQLNSTLMINLKNWEDPTNSIRNEIVFADRNHNYGAYDIRTNYSGGLLKSFVATITMITCIFGAPYIYSLFRPVEIETPYRILEYDFTHVKQEEEKKITEPEKTKPKEEVKKQNNNETQFTNHLVKDSLVNDSSLTQEQLANLNVSTKKDTTFTGDSNTLPEKKDTISDSGNGFITFADSMPEFPGGTKALLKFLSTNIKYPENARYSNIEGTVYINFIIDKTGRVSMPEIVKGIGGGCDEEALRVIRKMPVWSPGLQNNHPVNVRFMLPVKFRIL
jgi:periplasmic protein TonB